MDYDGPEDFNSPEETEKVPVIPPDSENPEIEPVLSGGQSVTSGQDEPVVDAEPPRAAQPIQPPHPEAPQYQPYAPTYPHYGQYPGTYYGAPPPQPGVSPYPAAYPQQQPQVQPAPYPYAQPYQYSPYTAPQQAYPAYPQYPAPPYPYASYPYAQPYPYYPYAVQPVYIYPPKNPNSKGRCFGRGMIAPGIFMGCSFVVSIIYAVILVFSVFSTMPYNPYSSPYGSYELENRLNEMLSMDNLMIMTGLNALICSIVFFFMHRRAKKNFANDTARPRSGPGVMAVVCVAAVAFNVLLVALFSFLPDWLFEGGLESSSAWWLDLAVAGLLAPVAEEFCFRLMAFNHFRRGIAFWPANFIQAGLFGLVHMNMMQSLYAFALGLFLGWIYERTRSIWAPILTHIFFNSANIALVYLIGDVDFSPFLLLIPAFIVSACGIAALRPLTERIAKPVE